MFAFDEADNSLLAVEACWENNHHPIFGRDFWRPHQPNHWKGRVPLWIDARVFVCHVIGGDVFPCGLTPECLHVMSLEGTCSSMD